MSIVRIVLIVLAAIVYLVCGIVYSLFGPGANPETGKSASAWWILFWPLSIFL